MKISKSSGVTYVELLVTIAIIGIVSVLAIASYVSGEQRQGVVYAAQQVEQDIRKVQALSLAGKKDSALAVRPCGYGVRFDNNPVKKFSYIIFRDLPGAGCNNLYDNGEELENGSVPLLKNVLIGAIQGVDESGVVTDLSSIDIVFTLPFAEIFFNNGSPFVEVRIEIKNNSGFSKTFIIKKLSSGSWSSLPLMLMFE